MAKFINNNIKNTSSGHILFKLNYSYHFLISYKKDINFCSKFKSADELLA